MREKIKDKLREDALKIFYAGLRAVDPARAVKRSLRREDALLKIGDTAYSLDYFKRILIVGAGKAAFPMAEAVEEILGDRISEGIVVVKHGYGGNLTRIKVKEASHPIPDEAGVKATYEIISLLQSAGEKDLVICLISGGGSALLLAPVEGISLEEKQKTTQVLLDCGASIQEINTIRKHLSLVKGGKLAKLAYPAHLQSLILSDVVGDRLDTIASGPTVPDPTTFEDCLQIIKKYKLQSHLPEKVLAHIKKGREGKVKETPKPGEHIFTRVKNLIVGSNILALKAAQKEAKRLGYNCLILSSSIQGETREVARVHTAICEEIYLSGNPIPPPACILSGGETTVVVRGKGKGGRNQEFALAACREIRGLEQVLMLSAGSDGTDGPTDAAGAFVDGSTWRRAQERGLNPEKFLNNNDSYHFFQKLGDLFITGPTNTNVMDLRILLVGEK
jgi:hydroxypyruvate reductase